MSRRIGKWAIGLSALAAFGTVAIILATPRDHKVEIEAVFPRTAPPQVWKILTDHASEPSWLPAFSRVERRPDDHGRPVWHVRAGDGTPFCTLMTLFAIPERRYERLLLREDQPSSQPWDARWIFELEPDGDGSRLKISEYGWTGGVVFFVMQRIISSPDAFLKYYLRRMGKALGDEPRIQVRRSH